MNDRRRRLHHTASPRSRVIHPGVSAEDRDGTVFRGVSADQQIHRYAFTGPPHLGFPSSFDVYGDGSVVIALAGGHTTGSVVVFVTVPSGKRYAFIGDLTWQLDGIRRRAERPWLMRKLADSDPALVRQGLLRLADLADLMQIVPAHDRDAYAGIPQLPVRMAPVTTALVTDRSPALGRALSRARVAVRRDIHRHGARSEVPACKR